MKKLFATLSKNLHIIVFIAIAIFLVFSYSYGYFQYDYAVPPGDDNIRHMSQAQYIIDNGTFTAHEGSFDPPIFHILLSSLSLATGFDIIQATKILAPLLAILSSLSLFFISKRLFNSNNLSIIILALFVFLSPQPSQIYNDGTYLNLFSAAFLLMYSLALLPPLLRINKIDFKIILPFSIITSALLLSHSLSSTYFFLIIGIFTVFLLVRYKKNFFYKKNYLLALLFTLFTLPFTWEFYLRDIVQKVLSVFGLYNIETGNILSADFTNISPIPTLGTYSWLLNYFLIIIAILGLIFLFKLFKNKINEKWILFIWLIAMFIGSRSDFFQLPERFARDMSLIITILAGIFIHKLLKDKNKLFKLSLIAILILIFSINVPGKIIGATKYNSMVRVQTSDEKAMNWIIDNTKNDDTILGMPRTIVAGDWGSYITIMTGRQTIDGTLCVEGYDDICDQLYNPNSNLSVNYYINNSIDYVYAGKAIMGGFISKDKIDWSYKEKLSETNFLAQVAEFPESELLGSVTIYKVDHEKLSTLAIP